MKRVLVQYKLKADQVEENKALVRAVFAELDAKKPAGLRYASFGFPDGVTFIHIASIESPDGKNPLSLTDAFPQFTRDIKDRCEEPPVSKELEAVGSYNLF
jgi:hypothetical protein